LFINESDIGSTPLTNGREFVTIGGPFEDDVVDWQQVAQQIHRLCGDDAYLAERRADMTAWLERHTLAASAQQLLDAARRITSSTTAPARFRKGPDQERWAPSESSSIVYGQGTRPANVELWGSFDLDRIGDQLFPIIADAVLRTLRPGSAVTLASPQGGAVPGWQHGASSCQPTASTSRRIIQLEEPGFFDQTGAADGIIISGASHSSHAAALALSARLPIAWHAARLPHAQFTALGLTPSIANEPTWAISDVWSRQLMIEHHRLLVRGGRLPATPYVCIDRGQLSDHERELVDRQVSSLRTRDSQVVCVALDAGEAASADAVTEVGPVGCWSLRHATVADRVAALVGNAGYLGASLQGGIVAATYGTPHAWFRNSPDLTAMDLALGRGHIIDVEQIGGVAAAMLAGELPYPAGRIDALRAAAIAELTDTMSTLLASSNAFVGLPHH